MRRTAASIACLLLCGVLPAGAADHPIATGSTSWLHVLAAGPDEFHSGQVHGRAVRRRIQELVALTEQAMADSQPLRKQIQADAQAIHASLNESQIQRLKGIAAGAEVSPQQLLHWNAWWQAQRGSASQGICLGSRTIGGRVQHFLSSSLAPSQLHDIVIVVHPSETGGFVTFGPPGILFPVGGLNAKGLSVTAGPSNTPDNWVRLSSAIEKGLGQATSLHAMSSALPKGNDTSIAIADGRTPDARLISKKGEFVGPGQRESPTGVHSATDAVIEFSDIQKLEKLLNAGTAVGPASLHNLLTSDGHLATVISASELEMTFSCPEGKRRRLRFATSEGKLHLQSEPWVKDAIVTQGTVTPKRSEPSPVPEIYQLDNTPFTYELEPQSVVGGVLISKLRFPSPVATEHPENNTVHAEYFRPLGSGPFPCVIVLHIAGGDFELSRFVARMLTRGNVAALFVKMPYYGERRPKQGRIRMISSDLERGLVAMRQVVLDLRRACDWIQQVPGLDGNRIGITGISLGSITGSLAAAIEPRITHACLIMGGAALQNVLFESSERDAKEYREMWIRAGGTRETFAEVFAPYDPATYADRLKQRIVLMISAREDEVIPMASSLALWEATGRQRIIWYPCGHYTMAKYLLPALGHTVRFFEDWPREPTYVEGGQ